MNSTLTIYPTQSPITSSQNIPQSHSPADSQWLCLHLPLSWMTTPKCVLGVLSSGAFGGMEMTGGLEGFLLDVVLFSERRRRKASKKNKARQVFRAISSTKRTWNSSGCWLWNLKFPHSFRSCSGFIRVGFRFLLDNAAVTLVCVMCVCTQFNTSQEKKC